MFDRTNVRLFQYFSGSSSFFTVEHFYEYGKPFFVILFCLHASTRQYPKGEFVFALYSDSQNSWTIFALYRISDSTEYKANIEERVTVFVKMFARKKGRTSRKILKRTNFITVEHFYEDGNTNSPSGIA